MAKSKCNVIIVTHNSEKFIAKCMDALQKQTVQPSKIIIVDSGSKDKNYLKLYENSLTKLVFAPNDIGFCCGNNIGMEYIESDCDYILFLNPDAFLTPTFIQKALDFMGNKSNSRVGILTGILAGYDIQQNKPSGKYDSTGIFQTWCGRWYDRSQGEPFTSHKFKAFEELKAICGALMFCRKAALDQVLIRGKEVFDNSFYMYKEDIDLSLRVSKKGWKLVLNPQLLAYHCRGWNSDRKKMPRHFRLCSAKNELTLHARNFSPHTLYSLFKYTAVKIFDV